MFKTLDFKNGVRFGQGTYYGSGSYEEIIADIKNKDIDHFQPSPSGIMRYIKTCDKVVFQAQGEPAPMWGLTQDLGGSVSLDMEVPVEVYDMRAVKALTEGGFRESLAEQDGAEKVAAHKRTVAASNQKSYQKEKAAKAAAGASKQKGGKGKGKGKRTDADESASAKSSDADEDDDDDNVIAFEGPAPTTSKSKKGPEPAEAEVEAEEELTEYEKERQANIARNNEALAALAASLPPLPHSSVGGTGGRKNKRNTANTAKATVTNTEDYRPASRVDVDATVRVPRITRSRKNATANAQATPTASGQDPVPTTSAQQATPTAAGQDAAPTASGTVVDPLAHLRD